MQVSDYIIKRIEDEGTKHVFTLTGGGGMFLIDSLGNSKKIKYIPCHHEQACAIAAEAYSRVSKSIGVALITTGPAGTNALTGFVCAWTDSVPLLVISGQAKTAHLAENTGLRQKGFHEVNIAKIVEPVAKFAVTIKDKNLVKYYVDKALYLAKNGRPGPVWLDIPLDIQSAEYNEKEQKKFNANQEFPTINPSISKSQINEIIKLIKNAKRPVILAGHGIKLSNSKKEFIELIERLQIPVVTTRSAFDIIENNHPLRAGFVGNFGQRAANFTIQNADLLICLGSRLAVTLVGYEPNLFAREAKIVYVDIDKNQIDHCFVKIDLPILGNVKDCINLLNKQITPKITIPNFKEWHNKITHWKKSFPNVTEKMKEQKKYVSSYLFYEILSDLMKKEDILVWDQGAAYHCAAVAFKTKKNQIAFSNEGLTPMGYGLPASIGACFASGGKKTMSVNGDGGLMLNLQELQTIIHFHLPIIVFIFNNDGYTSIKHTQTDYFNARFVGVDAKSGLSCPNFVKLGKAFNFQTFKIKTNNQLKPIIQKALSTQKPTIVEVMLDPLQIIEPRVKSLRMPDGKMVSKPLEDMFPYLDRDLLKKEMIIKTL